MKILKALGNNPYFNALRNIRALLDLDQKKRGALMVLLLFINAVFDVIGLAAIYPLANGALGPENIQRKWYLRWTYDFLGMEDVLSFLFVLSAIVFIFFLVKNALGLFITYLQSRYSFNVANRLSRKFFQYYYRQGFLFLENTDSGTKLDNVILVPNRFAAQYMMQAFLMSTELAVLGIIFVGIAIYKPEVVFVLLAIIIPIFFLIYRLTKNKVRDIGDEKNALNPVLYSNVYESLSAYPDVKLANKETTVFESFTKVLKRINHLDAMYQGVYAKINQRTNDVIMGLGLFIIFGMALLLREQSTQIVGILSVFALAAYRFLPSINRILGAMLQMKNAGYFVDRLRVVANQPLQAFETVERLPLISKIELQNISFSYPSSTQKILDNLNLTIHKGETIGFIGSSGSGKTTLLNLLLRFLTETDGRMLVDNVPLTDENQAAFQKNIGYVQQAVFIKNGTLEENIAFAERPDEINEEKLEQAIKDAMLSEFVEAHPEGKHMQLGESGVKLSGGQKQRVGIARALYKNAEILIFDEATSALDPNTEKAIVDTINHLTTLDKTIFIVAHRISTLEKCDRILELENGQIKRVLSYAELTISKGLLSQ